MFPDGSVLKDISLSGCFRWPVHKEPTSTLKKGREGPSTVGVGASRPPGIGLGLGWSPSPGHPSGLVHWPGAFLFLLLGCPFLSSSCVSLPLPLLGRAIKTEGGHPLLPVSEHAEWRPLRQTGTPAHSLSRRLWGLCMWAEGSPGPQKTELKDAGGREAPVSCRVGCMFGWAQQEALAEIKCQLPHEQPV